MVRQILRITILAIIIPGLVGCSRSNRVDSPTTDSTTSAPTTEAAESVPALVVEEGQTQVRVKITGMTCAEGCPIAVRALLEGVPGVAAVGPVDFANTYVDCAVQEGPFDPAKIAAVFAGTLFEGTALEDTAP